MKKLLLRTGIDGKQTTFLFGDQQIKDEAFLEDITALLSCFLLHPSALNREEITAVRWVAQYKIHPKFTKEYDYDACVHYFDRPLK